MANELIELQLQGSTTVYKVNDARITTTPITNPTHILGSKNANLTSIAPITIANLASVLGGSQIGDDNGFVKFINTFIDDTIDNQTPNGIYPLCGDTSGRGFVFRFFSTKHYRALEIRFIEQQMPSFRFRVNGQWSEWIQTPSFYNSYPDLSSLASALGGGIPFNILEDGMFIMTHRKRDDLPIMYKPHKWTAQQNAGEVADGVVVVEGGKVLVVAPTESATKLNWSSAAVSGGGTTTTDSVTAMSDWNGKANTAAQVTRAEASGVGYAPGFCGAYSRVNANGKGLTAGKWWLPSLGEMMMIYANMTKINYALSLIEGATQLVEDAYWTSTESSATNAWKQSLNDGGIGYGTKATNTLRVRPVSAFIS